VLAALLDAPELRWTPGAALPKQALAVFCADGEGWLTGLFLDRAAAAALVTRGLRSGALSPRSTPAEVRSAMARFLVAHAENAEGAPSGYRVLEEPQDVRWGRAWGVTFLSPSDGQLHAAVRVGKATPPTHRAGFASRAELTRPRPLEPDGDSATVELTVTAHALSSGRRTSSDGVLDLLRLRAQVVVALNAVSEDDVSGLAPGDLWFPGDGWLVLPSALGVPRSADLDGAGVGPRRALLALPGQDTAPWVECAIEDGKRTLRWTGEVWRDPGARPGVPRDDRAERVWVSAGSLDRSLAEWSAWPAAGKLEWHVLARQEGQSQHPERRGTNQRGTDQRGNERRGVEEQTSALASGRSDGEPWTLWVGPTLRAWGVPRWVDGRWGLELSEVVGP
jgi:hypothetical protein